MSTIASISTPNAVGGIAVIRISGESAIDVAARIFKPIGDKNVLEMAGYTCAYGHAYNGDEIIDDCILTVFKAPHSFTGEDTAEISCHGGLYVSRKILWTALKNGAVAAEAGEFTKRAFLNGKIDLTRAEAVMDIISAKSESELKMAETLHEGAVFRSVQRCSEKLLKILSALSAWTDYPDENIPEVEQDTLLTELTDIHHDLELLIQSYDRGRIIKNGVSTAIVGRPNAGKSTLFNCLTGYERSIVTDIAGTTRDVVEESVLLGDVMLRLSDTAGIRETNDVIEEIGVENAWKTVNRAELVLALFDGNSPLTDDDYNLIKRIKDMNCIAIVNKIDKKILIDENELKKHFIHLVYISAKEGKGISNLELAVKNIFKLSPDQFSTVTVANERQKLCVDRSILSINQAIDAIKSGVMFDAVNVLIEEAEQSLLELIGKRITDAVVDEVFTRFCVGK